MGERSEELASWTRDVRQFDWASTNLTSAWLALPVNAAAVIIGLTTGRLWATLVVVSGAVTVGFGAVQRVSRFRALPMALAAIGFAGSAWVGAVLGRRDFAAGVSVTAVWAVGLAIASEVGGGVWWVALQCTIALFVSASYPAGVQAATERAGLVLLGGTAQLLVSVLLWTILRQPLIWKDPADPPHLQLMPTRFGRLRFPMGDSGLQFTLRTVGVLMLADAVSHAWPWRSGYWIPMTAAIVLKVDLRTTLARGVARTLGTAAGVALVTAFISTARPSPPVLGAAVVVAVFGAVAVQRINYGLFAMLITAYVVCLLALGGLPGTVIALDRAAATIVGGGIAMGSFALLRPGDRIQQAGNPSVIQETITAG